MYDFVGSLLGHLTNADPGGLKSGTVEQGLVVGMLGLVGIVLSFFLDGVRTRNRRARHSPPVVPPDHAPDDDEVLHAELVARAIRAETACAKMQDQFDENKRSDRREIRKYREFIAAIGYDPDKLPRLPLPRRAEEQQA